MLRLASHIITSIRSLVAIGVLLLSAILLLPRGSGAQSIPGHISIHEGGQVWIEGSAGPVDFSCRAKELSGQGQINNSTNPESSIEEKGKVRLSVSLPVKSLDCGKKAMNNDMYGALKADKHPSISYQLIEAKLVSSKEASSEGWLNIETRGIMEIGGVKDTTIVYVQGKTTGENSFQVKGRKDIHMDTYGIEPPSKMFGLIRANKNLRVHFDVTVKLQHPVQSFLFR